MHTPKCLFNRKIFKKIFLLLYLFESGTKKVRGYRRKNLQKKTKAFFLKQEKDFQASVFYTLKGIFCISKQIIYPIGLIVINSLLTLHPKGYRIIIDNYDKEQ